MHRIGKGGMSVVPEAAGEVTTQVPRELGVGSQGVPGGAGGEQ